MKKRGFIIFVLLILYMQLAYAEDNSTATKVVTVADEESAQVQITKSQQKYESYAMRLKREREERVEKYTERALLSLGLVFIFFMLFIAIRQGLVKKIRIWAHRHVYFVPIIWMYRRGKSIGEIRKELLSRGFKSKYVYDATHVFRKYKDRDTLAVKIDTKLHDIHIYRKLERKLRRRKLISKIRKMKKKNMSMARIKKALVQQGWKETYVDDAIFRNKHPKDNRFSE